VIEARAYEMDSLGHVNHAVYINYFEQARFEALAECGFTYDVLAQRGWAIHVVRIEVDYLSEVLLGDRLRIRTWAGEFRRTSMVMLQEARRDPRGGESESTLVARARIVAVWIGENRRPIRVLEEVRDGFGELEAPTPERAVVR
jgi:acyl-CoA thioester hydrolase